MKQTVLIVEDDPMIRQLIKIYLEKEGYHVVEASNGEVAQQHFLTEYPCLIILDLMLPRVSGEAFCKWIRHEQQSDIPIIMLSAKARIDDKIAGLKMGADNYVTKPFNPEELMAHVEASMRRGGMQCQQIVLGDLCLKPRKGEVWLKQKLIYLTSHEFALLYCFMQHPNIVLSREELIEQLYPHDEQIILERTIDAHIKKLREKIEEIPSEPKRIQTVRGMGYKFVHA